MICFNSFKYVFEYTSDNFRHNFPKWMLFCMHRGFSPDPKYMSAIDVGVDMLRQEQQ